MWLESLEDAAMFPPPELAAAPYTLTVFVHPLATGLLRVKLAGHAGK